MKSVRRLICVFVLTCLAAGAADLTDIGIVANNPRNCSIEVTLIRYSGKTAMAAEQVHGCRQISELLATLKKAGTATVLYDSTRTVCSDGAAAVDFDCLETRPAVYFGATTATNVIHDYGMKLRLEVRDPGVAMEPPVWVVGWSGNWSGSPQLLSKWEALAVRGFNAASKIPGIVYEKTEEDEDGFVNTGGTDISGWFKKKPKNAPPAAADKPVTPAGPTEPDYRDDTTFETVKLAGQRVARAGGLVVTRHLLGASKSTEELFLVIGCNSTP